MSDAQPLSISSTAGGANAFSAVKPFARLVLRYAFSTIGPMSIAGAHFLAALLFLHAFNRTAFGIFSFVFIAVPFCLSMGGALFGAAIVNSANAAIPMSDRERAAYMKANVVFSALAGLAVTGLMRASTADGMTACLLGVYGFFMTARWFARCHAYAVHRMPRAIVSDLIYSSLTIGGLGLGFVLHLLTPAYAAALLSASAATAVLGFGRDYLVPQLRALRDGSLRAFLPVWRDLSRWSLLGVVSTEMTANAHAYLVTFIAGPRAFALLAVGSLFMRPVTLVLTALPDAERPHMARAVAAGNFAAAMKAVAQFRVAAFSVLAASAIGALGVMLWVPQYILKRGYDPREVIGVICIWFVVMGIRGLRTPESVLLQVMGEFKPLAGASVRASLVSLGLTLILLLLFGPLVSLGGILIGEIVVTAQILMLGRTWRARHG